MPFKMSRKRSYESNSTDDSIQIKRSNCDKFWDSYCWLCHKPETDRRCISCTFSYHQKCIRNSRAEEDYRCDMCDKLNSAKQDYARRQVNMVQFHKMLQYVLDRLNENNDIQRLRRFPEFKKPAMAGRINSFHLEHVEEKVRDEMYKTTVEFIKDIRIIRHNAEIVLPASSSRLACSKKMEKQCDKEMYDIEICNECFLRSNECDADDWFTKVCDPPHLLVWAKVNGHPFWPAKVIARTETGKLDVRFFGQHEMSFIHPTNCYLFSWRNPNKNTKLDYRTKRNIDKCMKEVKEYVTNIEQAYKCKLKMALPKKPLKLPKIGHYLEQMIPGLKLPKLFRLKTRPGYLPKKLSHKKPTSKSSGLSCLQSPSPTTTSIPTQISWSLSNLPRMKNIKVALSRCDSMPEFIAAIEARKLAAKGQKDKSTEMTIERPEKPTNVKSQDQPYEAAQLVPTHENEIIQTDVTTITVPDSDGSHINNAADDISITEVPSDEDDTFYPNEAVSSTPMPKSRIEIARNQFDKNESIGPNDEACNTADEEHSKSRPLNENNRNNCNNLQSKIDELFNEGQKQLQMIIELTNKLQAKSQKDCELEQTISQLRHDLDKKCREFDALEAALKLKSASTENLRKKVLNKINELAEQRQKQNAETHKMIAETKMRRWCVICTKDASNMIFKQPVCSSECLCAFWTKNMRMQLGGAADELLREDGIEESRANES